MSYVKVSKMLKQVQHDKGKNFSRTWCKAPIVSAKVPVYRQHQFNPQPKVVETVFISSFLFRFFFFDKKEEKTKQQSNLYTTVVLNLVQHLTNL